MNLPEPELTETGFKHRNLRTRRIMHLCIQDDQIVQKFLGLASADMARLPHLINTKIVFSSKWTSPSAGTTPVYFELALLYNRNRPFLTRHSLSSS
jgi:hypothetical protein